MPLSNYMNGMGGKKKRKKMRKLRITEISGVGTPAQEGARALIMKRADAENVTFTSAPANQVTFTSTDRTIQTEMFEMTPEEIQKLQKAAEIAKAEVEKLNKVAAMKPEHFAHYSGLFEKDRDAFVDMDDAKRDAVIAKAQKAKDDQDPIVFTTKTGVEIRKSDGVAALAMAKQLDSQAESIAVLKQDNEKLLSERNDTAFEKRAEKELPHLPGTVKARAALLKAAEGIEDENDRKQAVSALRAQNNAMSWAFTSKGYSADDGVIISKHDEGVAPSDTLDSLVAEYRKDHPDVNESAAMDAVLHTERGAAAYNKSVQIERMS